MRPPSSQRSCAEQLLAPEAPKAKSNQAGSLLSPLRRRGSASEPRLANTKKRGFHHHVRMQAHLSGLWARSWRLTGSAFAPVNAAFVAHATVPVHSTNHVDGLVEDGVNCSKAVSDGAILGWNQQKTPGLLQASPGQARNGPHMGPPNRYCCTLCFVPHCCSVANTREPESPALRPWKLSPGSFSGSNPVLHGSSP